MSKGYINDEEASVDIAKTVRNAENFHEGHIYSMMARHRGKYEELTDQSFCVFFFFLAICKALLSYHSSPLLYNASSRGWGRHWGGDQPEAVIWLLKLVCCRAGVVKHYGLEKPLPTSPKTKMLSPPLLTWYTIGIMIIVHDNIIAYCCFRSNFRAWHA